jgi:hypothetical protein
MVVREEIERLVNSFLLLDDDHPSGQASRNLSELSIKSLLRVSQNTSKIAKTSIDFMDLVPTKITVLVHTVQIRTQGFRDLPDLGNNLLSMCKYDEDVFADGLIICRINERFWDLRLIHVQITSQCSPEDPLECSNPVSGNDP